jgi:hypothetical protein
MGKVERNARNPGRGSPLARCAGGERALDATPDRAKRLPGLDAP